MEQYVIKGGNPLVGEVEIGGAKNAALPPVTTTSTVHTLWKTMFMMLPIYVFVK